MQKGVVRHHRNGKGFLAGSLIGTLGGLVGLGGAEFRLPVLVGGFRIPTLEAIILNKAMSLVVVAFSLIFRTRAIPIREQFAHWDVTLNLLAGSLIGAWWAAGHATTLSKVWLDRIVLALLMGLSLLMLSEAWVDWHSSDSALFESQQLLRGVGVIAGFGIGVVAAFLGVAGGEVLIPTIVLLYGLDIKIAGSLSLSVSLPTMLVGFARYSRSNSFAVLQKERSLFNWMMTGSIVGAATGGRMVGFIPTQWLMTSLGLILLTSAYKTFQHLNMG